MQSQAVLAFQHILNRVYYINIRSVSDLIYEINLCHHRCWTSKNGVGFTNVQCKTSYAMVMKISCSIIITSLSCILRIAEQLVFEEVFSGANRRLLFLTAASKFLIIIICIYLSISFLYIHLQFLLEKSVYLFGLSWSWKA